MKPAKTPTSPILSIVGVSGSGKTTLLEQVIATLTARGRRVGSVKHHHAGELDTPGKDSWRHTEAGAVAVALVGEHGSAVYRAYENRPALDEVCLSLGEVDIVLVEGFKGEGVQLIEVVRTARSSALVSDPASLLAVVSDNPELGQPGRLPVFPLDDPERLAAWIDAELLGGPARTGSGSGAHLAGGKEAHLA